MDGRRERVNREALGVQGERLAAGEAATPVPGESPARGASRPRQARPSPRPPLSPQTCPLRSHTGPSAATPPPPRAPRLKCS